MCLIRGEHIESINLNVGWNQLSYNDKIIFLIYLSNTNID